MSSRATLRIDEDVMRQLKQRAAADDRSLTDVVNETLRKGLLAGARPLKVERFVQKTHDMGRPLVDLSHMNAFLDELDAEEFRRKMATGQ